MMVIMTKINTYGFSHQGDHLKKISGKIMTHLLKEDLSKNVYKRRRKTFSKASNSSFFHCP